MTRELHGRGGNSRLRPPGISLVILRLTPYARLMRVSTLAFAALVTVALAGCSQEFTVPLPERQNDPGYAGDWRAIVAGQQMTIRVSPFEEGGTSTPARILWADGSIDWPATCRLLPDGDDSLDLGCTLSIGAEPPFCAVVPGNEPSLEITESVPRVRLVVEIGGSLRAGTASECTGPVIVDWGIRTDYTFVPG